MGQSLSQLYVHLTFGSDVFKPFRLTYDRYAASWGFAPGSAVTGFQPLCATIIT